MSAGRGSCRPQLLGDSRSVPLNHIHRGPSLLPHRSPLLPNHCLQALQPKGSSMRESPFCRGRGVKTVFAFMSCQGGFPRCWSASFCVGQEPTWLRLQDAGMQPLAVGLSMFSPGFPSGWSAWRLSSIPCHLLLLFDVQDFFFKQKQSKQVRHS